MKKILMALLLIFPALEANSTSFYIDTRLETQVRENSLPQREAPFYAYLDTGLKELPNKGTFDVSLRNNYIFNVKDNEFDLYQAVFRMDDIAGVVGVSAGRQFVSPGFHAYLMDGLTTRIGKEDWPVAVTIIGGVPRYLEMNDFKGTAGLIAGATIELQGVDRFHLKLSGIYDKLDIKKTYWKKNDTVLTGVATSYLFNGRFMPNLYGNFEYDTAGKDIDTGLAGFRIRPFSRLFWNIEGGFFNTNRNRQRDTIFSLFSRSGFYQGRTGISVTAIESAGPIEDFVITGGYSYQRYHSTASSKADIGHLADGGIKFSVAPIYLTVLASYKYYKSYGGKANDIYFELHDEPFDILNFTAGGNITKYSKITNQKDTAISAFLMADLNIIKNFVLSAGGEYLRNDTFSREFRATAKLSYKFEGKL